MTVKTYRSLTLAARTIIGHWSLVIGHCLLCSFLLGSVASAQKVDTYNLVHDAALGLPGLASPQPFEMRLLASTDAKHQNKDYLLLAPQEKRTAATLKGPALVLRLWFTSSVPEKTTVTLLVDGKPIPLWKDGKVMGYPPVKALGGAHEKAFFSYYPFIVRQSLQLNVVNGSEKENKFFYQVNYQPSPPSLTEVDTSDARWRDLERQLEKAGEKSVEPAREFSTSVQCSPRQETELSKVSGSSVVTFLQLTPATSDVAALEKLYLLIRWDDEKDASVMAPFSWMCGQYFERGQINSALLKSDGKSLIIRFPMPFERSAKFSLWNGHSSAVKVDVKIQSQKPSDAISPYRFCATAATQTTERGKPFLLLDTQGEGVFLGATVGLQGGEMNRTPAFLEGNERIEVDDDAQKTLEGTGAEDFFNSAWYFPDKPFSFPFHGMTFKGKEPQRVSAYRLMLTDRVPFKKHLRVTLQHGGRNSSPGCLYRAVTFWYQKEPRTFSPRLSFTAAAPAAAKPRLSYNEENSGSHSLIWIVGGAVLAVGAFIFYRLVGKRNRTVV
jgi:hypothetical protein